MSDVLEERIGILFRNKDLLREALTHRSYLNEHSDWPVPHNERLEFLGDAVLELVVTDFLFKKFAEYDEGILTNIRAALVNQTMLAQISEDIELEGEIFLSHGQERGTDKARESILANGVEALIGAAYLDGGYETAQIFIERFILSYVDEVMKDKRYQDPKSSLQEIVQEQLKITPLYKVLEESGPDHEKEFVVGVYFGDKLSARGVGGSKQDAERVAAETALKEIRDNE